MDANLTLSLIWKHLGVILIPRLKIYACWRWPWIPFRYSVPPLVSGSPAILHLIVLLPWRSIVILTTLVVANTPLMIWNFGLGTLLSKFSDWCGSQCLIHSLEKKKKPLS